MKIIIRKNQKMTEYQELFIFCFIENSLLVFPQVGDDQLIARDARVTSKQIQLVPICSLYCFRNNDENTPKKTYRQQTISLFWKEQTFWKRLLTRASCRVKRKESRRDLRPDSVWWLRELDLNQRPSGYRTAPVAVPEICCLQSAAPDFERS